MKTAMKLPPLPQGYNNLGMSTIYTASMMTAYAEQAVREALAEQPAPAAQQEPVFCEYCGGNDEDPQDHCMDCTRPRWEPVTQELLNNQHPWLYEPMWIASGSMVEQGYYEWRQGQNPDRFITDGGEDWAFNFDYVMPIVRPSPPTEAAHGITKGNA